MTDFLPGDRVLVTHPDLPEGGMTGTVTNFDTGVWVTLDNFDDGPIECFAKMTLLHRPRPPRPVVEPFIRSDGAEIRWAGVGGSLLVAGWWPVPDFTAEDLVRLADMIRQVAEQMEWDEKYEVKS